MSSTEVETSPRLNTSTTTAKSLTMPGTNTTSTLINRRGRYGPYNSPVAEPGTAMQSIVAEMCSFNTAKTSVMLQIASPGVARGVHAHSSFTLRPLERARRSLFYIYVMTFGTPTERRKVTDATHQAHMRVKQKENKQGEGRSYDANDEDLQLWVAATIYWSLILGYEEVMGKLDGHMADQAYREFSVLATGLRVPPEKWPADRAAFAEYWRETVSRLEVTREAREVSVDLLWPTKNLPWGIWLVTKLTGPMQRFTTIELLPERVRNDFGYPSTRYTRWMYWLKRAVDRKVYPWLPLSWRQFVMRYHMAKFRKRMGTGMKL
ncbi:oxygenase MpaB family protein [Microdochium nivale]|nr:oxygenase MpaB family protein [Microdochium nivale]